jgi:hypothetical protein
MNQRGRGGIPNGEWPLTFKQAFCTRFACTQEQYESAVFWRVVFRHALPLAWFIRRVSPGFFAEDLDLIREVGEITNPEIFKNEVNYFHGRNIRHKSWIRTVLRVRVSGGRLLKLRRQILG